MPGFFKQPDNIPLIQKAPAAVLDYSEDWSKWLASGETISSFTATVDAGLTLASSNSTPGGAATLVTTWLSGGTAGTSYLVSITVTTTQSRTDTRSFRVQVVAR